MKLWKTTLALLQKEMGKYRVPRFEFSASSSPNFEFPASENSALVAENSDTWIHPSCPLADNSPMLADNSEMLTDLSCPLAGNSSTQAENLIA